MIIHAFQRCGELQLAKDVCNTYELPLSLIEGEATEENLETKRVVTTPVQLAERHVESSKYPSFKVESDSQTELHIQSDIPHTRHSDQVKTDASIELHIESDAGMVHGDIVTHGSRLAVDGGAEPYTGSDLSSPLGEHNSKSFVDISDQYKDSPTLSVSPNVKGHTPHDHVASDGFGRQHRLSLDGDKKAAKPQQSPTFSGGSPKSESLEFHSLSDNECYGGALSLSEVPAFVGKSTFSHESIVPFEKRPGDVSKTTGNDDDSGVISAVSSLSKSLVSQKGLSSSSEVSFSISMFVHGDDYITMPFAD